MSFVAYGKNTMSNPRYIAAVKAQQAKERERAQLAGSGPKLVGPSIRASVAEHTPEFIIASVARAHDLAVHEVTGGTKTIAVVAARQEAIAKIKTTFPDMTLRDIGKLFNRSKKMVERALIRAGVVSEKRRYIDRAEVLRLISLDMTPQQIADQMGFTVVTVLNASFQVRNKELSEEKMERLDRAIRLRAKGYSYAKMGEILGVSGSMLQRDFLKVGLV